MNAPAMSTPVPGRGFACAADSERGSLSAFVVVLSFSLFALVGLAVDGGHAVAARGVASGVAEQAARVGAGQLSAPDLRLGRVSIDPSAATAAAQRYLEAAGYHGSVTVTPATVTVHVSASTPTEILGIVGISHIDVSVTELATDLHGVTRAD